MAIKKIFAPLQTVELAPTALQAAIAIARRHHAHIDALHIRQRPNIPASGYYRAGGALISDQLVQLTETIEADAARLKAIFTEIMASAGIMLTAPGAHRDDAGATASWCDRQGILPYDLSSAARVSDIAVFGRADGELNFPEASFIEELIFQSGRPVLIAPAGKFDRTPRRILVAWNGGREAARALSAAMPLFEETDAVSVFTIGRLPADREGPEKAAELLRLHGVKADAERLAEADGADEDTLLATAASWKADLIVMGAWSHARWRELVLGGFTRRMLKQAEFPLLLAH